MLTDEEILESCRERVRGDTWEEIAERLGVSVSTVYQAVRSRVFAGKRYHGSGVYVNVRRWMREAGVSLEDIAMNAGYGKSTVRDQLDGRRKLSAVLVRTIMHLSGMTEEEVREVREKDDRRESAGCPEKTVEAADGGFYRDGGRPSCDAVDQ